MAGMTLSLLIFSAVYLVGVSGRMAGDPYVVEIKLVVDHEAIYKWQRLTGKSGHDEFMKLVNSLFFDAGELYSSLISKDLDYKFVLKNVTLDVENVVYDPSGEIGTEGLKQFKKWMYKQKPFEKTDFDLAMLLTGYDVTSHKTDKGTLGYGMIGQICTSEAVGMMELRKGTYRDAFVLAHEMAHILGANHDGVAQGYGSSCKPDGYIMTSGIEPWSPNHFDFSDCSYLYLFYKLNDLPWQCLDDGDASKAVQGKRLGSTMTPDETCKRELDSDAFMDRGNYWTYGDNMCIYLACNRGDGEIIKSFAPQGMFCGKNKHCVQGKCVKTDEGSDVSDDCPYGDQPKIFYEGYTRCVDLPLYHCDAMRTQCCKRCAKTELDSAEKLCQAQTGNPEAQLYREAYRDYGYGDTFCQHLACTTGSKSNGERVWTWHKPGALTNQMICGKNKRCSNGRCLPAANGNPDIQDKCPFGDQPYITGVNFDCTRAIKSYSDINAMCKTYGHECCATCRGLITQG